MASPARPAGQPVPSQRSWIVPTTRATWASAGAAAMMRSPAAAISALEDPTPAGSTSRPHSWSSAARRTVSRSFGHETEGAGDGVGAVGDGDGVAAELGVANGLHAEQRVLDLADGGGAAGVLLGVHALVGDAQGVVGAVGFGRERDRAVGAADPEAVALLGERERGAVEERDGILGPDLEEHAELVAAHAEDLPAGADVFAQVGAEAGEEDVARRMAEGVVVVLEAVEVEQGERDRRLGDRLREGLVERAGQCAAVAEAGERVGQGLAARGVQHADVLAERQRQADHHEDQRRGGERDGQRVEVAHRAVDQQLERDATGDQRRGEQAQAVRGCATTAQRRSLPGGDGDQEEPGPPAGVEPAAGLVGALRGAHEVHRVREPEHQDAAGEQHPGAVQPPAGTGEGADAHGQQEEVGDRIGKARSDRQRGA